MAFADIVSVKNWTTNKTAELESFATSDTSGQNAQHSGTKDWTASFVANGIQTGSPLTVGTSYTFKFFENGTEIWTGIAMVESLAIGGDIQQGATVPFTYSLGGDGALTETGGSGTAPFSSTNGNVSWEAIA